VTLLKQKQQAHAVELRGADPIIEMAWRAALW